MFEACGNFGARPHPPPSGRSRSPAPRPPGRAARARRRRAPAPSGRSPRARPRAAPLLEDLLPPLPPGVGDGLEHRAPVRHPVARLRRVVGADVERRAVRGEERVERPSALSGHRLAGLHAQGVDVGTLLAVDLDRHEVLVHHRGDGRILERLALHHVAPVAGRVADRDEQRNVALGAPRARASSPQGNQSTGFSLCWSRYGEVSSARRLAIGTRLPAGRGAIRLGGDRALDDRFSEGEAPCPQTANRSPPHARRRPSARTCMPSAPASSCSAPVRSGSIRRPAS